MPTGAAPALPHARGLDTARGLRFFAGLAPVYQEALGDFVQLYGPGLPGVEAYLAAPSPEGQLQVRREVHSLGGAAAALGATVLEQQAQGLDLWLRQPERPADAELVPPLRALCDELAALVRALRADGEKA